MYCENINLIFFSPTGTTKRIIEAIGNGFNNRNLNRIDLTLPDARQHTFQSKKEDLLVIAVPVYMGRIPLLLSDWFKEFTANETPTIAVVVYGNRAYENALLELSDIIASCGCRVIGAAAFIGEHSFSSKEFPSSVGRPDQADLKQAYYFGNLLDNLLDSYDHSNEIPSIDLPGVRPYGGVTDLWHLDFIDRNDRCTNCGLCIDHCPTGAINKSDSASIDINRCTLCCACIKYCPMEAKSIKQGPMKEAALRCTKFTERKNPEIFLPDSKRRL